MVRRHARAGFIGAAVLLVGTLVLAAALHAGVTLAYDESGNGCRTLTDASDTTLQLVMIPVRLLVIVCGTGVLVFGGVGEARGDHGVGAWSAGAAVAGLIALMEMFFIAIDVLTALVPLLALAFVAIVGAIAQAVRAVENRAKPVAPWCWTAAAWFLIAGVALPIALLALTGDAAIRSC